MKALTFKQYRTANIILLTLIFVILESAVTLGANLWFRELPSLWRCCSFHSR